MATIRILYFAWLRERIGKSDETVDVPDTVETVGDLLAWLGARGPEYAVLLERREVVRAAVDRTHAKLTASLKGAREIGFFPPVTGG